MVDWDLAVALGSRLAGDGPEITREDADAVVAELRADAARSTGLVREFTGLVAAEHTAPVLVVDRPGWVQANADGFATVLAPVVDKLSATRAPRRGSTHAVGSRVTGAEVGALLGFLAGKVLGQFDPFYGAGTGGCCSSRPTSCTSSASSASTRTTSGSGSASTRRPTGSSSPPTPWLADHLLAEMHAHRRHPRAHPASSTTASAGSPRRSRAATAAAA